MLGIPRINPWLIHIACFLGHPELASGSVNLGDSDPDDLGQNDVLLQPLQGALVIQKVDGLDNVLLLELGKSPAE